MYENIRKDFVLLGRKNVKKKAGPIAPLGRENYFLYFNWMMGSFSLHHQTHFSLR